MELRNRVFWLIGASSGIGAALAPRLAAKGARLAISSRDVDELEQVAAASPGGAVVKPLDVTEDGAVQRVADELRAEMGFIEMMMYNAGAWTAVDVRHFDGAAFERQIAVNYVGMVRAIAAVLPGMVEQKKGAIIGTGSLSGYAGFPRAEAYGSTKAAVNSLLQSLRIELRSLGIRVVTVNPGFVDTELTEGNDFPMPFMISPEQAAEAIVGGLEGDRDEIHFPRRLSLPLKLFTALPRPVYEWAMSRALKPK